MVPPIRRPGSARVPPAPSRRGTAASALKSLMSLKSRRPPIRWKALFHFLIGVAISAAFLYLAARHIPSAHILREIKRASLPLLGAAGALVVLANVVRALRWMALFGGAEGIRFRPVFGSMTVGYLANNVLPARLGEVVRIYLVERTTGVNVGLAAATIVMERLTEAFMLLLAAIALSGLAPLPPALRTAVPIAGAILLSIAALLILLVLRPVRVAVLRLIDVETGRVRLPRAWHSAIMRAASQFIAGVQHIAELTPRSVRRWT